jgi:hypothetical protein
MKKPTPAVRSRAVGKVYWAIKNCTLKRQPCEVCGAIQNPGKRKKIQAHHVNYNKPLEVVWLCTDCHGHVHAGRRRGIRTPIAKIRMIKKRYKRYSRKFSAQKLADQLGIHIKTVYNIISCCNK